MQVFEGSTLTFDIPNIFRSLDYDLVVRHEHFSNFPNKWDKATFELISLDGPAAGKCGTDAPSTIAPTTVPVVAEGSGSPCEGSGCEESPVAEQPDSAAVTAEKDGIVEETPPTDDDATANATESENGPDKSETLVDCPEYDPNCGDEDEAAEEEVEEVVEVAAEESRRKRAVADADPGTVTITSGSFTMLPDTLHTIIEPTICLENGKRYQLKFTFDQYEDGSPNTKASIYIDSVSKYIIEHHAYSACS